MCYIVERRIRSSLNFVYVIHVSSVAHIIADPTTGIEILSSIHKEVSDSVSVTAITLVQAAITGTSKTNVTKQHVMDINKAPTAPALLLFPICVHLPKAANGSPMVANAIPGSELHGNNITTIDAPSTK
mmetsp:Transcript_9433/g.11668  ORF Transcript_9433/g.11668 Transcript_9433/m.11668 type:complete len:129 (+) Transcript_9433:43-429(+)